MRRVLVLWSAATLLTSFVLSGFAEPVKVQSKDKCPVCGMFVAKYPDFVAEIVFKDHSYAVFDGAKDMFKYYNEISKYNSGKKVSDIESIYVTDYYDLKLIDAFKAFYVEGSNVFGPMGKELIAFEKESDAKEFMADHSGASVLRFSAVSRELVRTLD